MDGVLPHSNAKAYPLFILFLPVHPYLVSVSTCSGELHITVVHVGTSTTLPCSNARCSIYIVTCTCRCLAVLVPCCLIMSYPHAARTCWYCYHVHLFMRCIVRSHLMYSLTSCTPHVLTWGLSQFYTPHTPPHAPLTHTPPSVVAIISRHTPSHDRGKVYIL